MRTLMTEPRFNEFNEEAGLSANDPVPWHELAAVERAIAQLVAERPRATVREIAEELATLEASLAAARGRLERLAGEAQAQRRETQLAQVIEALLPTEVPPPAAVWHAQQSARARLELLREFGAWTAGEVAERAASGAANRSALASGWRAAGRIVGVDWHGRTLYPAFQFEADGQPRRVIATVLAHLRRAALSDWQAALWFTSPTGWLDDRRPVDLLDDDAEAAATAASAFDQRPT
jgi:hypothetical protein